MRLLFRILLLSVWAASAYAHKPSDSYLALSLHGNRVTGQWDIALRDLDFAIGLDADGNGEITWGEVKAKHKEIAAYALARLLIAADGATCQTTVKEHLIDNHSDGAYEVLRFAADCPATPEKLSIKYTLFFDVDPQHRGLLRFKENGSTHTAVLSPDHETWQFERHSFALGRQFLDFFQTGVWHIWTGFDHILFLCALLLPAVLDHRGGRWQAVASFRQAFREVLSIVTAFTIAHSITLTLAVLGFITLPSRLIESTIAASVVAAALNNLYPLIEKRLWVVAFVFGLVHGLGFANVLTDLALPKSALAVSLVSFNLGVEAGQLAIVATFLPLAYLSRRSPFYPRLVLGAGSLGIVAVASIWLVERSLNINIFS
ncbi:MAG: HupE/UreJ family protein [Acetobacteraceae bacterium]|nr:HupE/UreJ family protein [Acetobacteraceae bacterium]